MAIRAYVRDLVRHDQVVFGVHYRLHVVTDNASTLALAGHRAGVRVRQRHLPVRRGFHPGLQTLKPAHLILQRRDPLLQTHHLAGSARCFFAIHPIKLLEVLGDALLDQPHPRLHLAAGEVAVAMVDRLELTAVDRDRGLREQPPAAAQYDELAADVRDRRGILRTKVSQRLEVGRQPSDQPHQLEIALRLPLESARRLNPVQIAVQIDLEHRCWVITRPTRGLRLHALKTQSRQIKLAHERVHDPHRILFRDVLLKLRRQQRPLGSIRLIDESAHSSSSSEKPTQYYSLNMTFSHSLGQYRSESNRTVSTSTVVPDWRLSFSSSGTVVRDGTSM